MSNYAVAGHAFSPAEEEMAGRMNRELFALCERLPAPLRERATIFLIRYAGNSFSFFQNFPAPLWALLHSLGLEEYDEERQSEILAGHAMALFLHSLDDHLHDGQLSVTHLFLQLRTEAWIFMKECWSRLRPDGENCVRQGIERYFDAISREDQTDGIEEFLENAKSQAGTWLVTPTLLAREPRLSRAAVGVMENFVVLYRVLDDLADFEKDLYRGETKSLYHAMDRQEREIYRSFRGIKPGDVDRDAWVLRCRQSERLFGSLLKIAAEHRERALQCTEEVGWNRLGELIQSSWRQLHSEVHHEIESA